MVDPTLVAAGIVVLAATAYVSYRKGKTDGIVAGRAAAERVASHEAHEEATERAPPVDVGDRVSVGVKEFKEHHSGDRVAVCKKAGFVVFVEDVPTRVDVGDVLEAEVVAFGPDRNAAEASYLGVA